MSAMTTTTTARPGTPFPSTESISYFAPQASSSSSRRASQSLHFPIPHRAAPTPPSLLKRTSSSASSSSASYHLSRTPSASTPVLSPTHTFSGSGRRGSTCSSISGSEGMPATPIAEEADELELELLDDVSESPLQLPESLPLSPATQGKGFPVKQFYSTFQAITTSASSSAPAVAPAAKRPKFTRRDTPRPQPDGVPAMSAFWDHPILSPIADEQIKPQRRLTSVVDGKSWIVVA